MNRILGNVRWGATRVGLVIVVVGAIVVAFALPAGANTGYVTTSQTCYVWSATVTLNANVTPDHLVEVSSTIPGTTGIVDGHYDTKGTGPQQIWQATGTAPSSGTVTLTILNSDRSLDSTDSASLPPSEECPTTTTTPAPTTTVAPPTTTTPAPTTTVAPPTTVATSSSVEGTTVTLAPTTTVSATTSTAVVPSTATSAPPPVPVTEQGSTTTAGATTTTSIAPGGISAMLPFTGSGTVFPAIFGLSCLTGGGMLAIRRRRRWVVRR
jgi:LPXTG-motif cell wall-anchored protein